MFRRNASAADNRCPLGHRISDQPFDFFTGGLADKRTNLGFVETIANPQSRSFSLEGVNKGIVDAVDHIKPLGRGANLARHVKRPGHCPRGGDGDGRMGCDDHRV